MLLSPSSLQELPRIGFDATKYTVTEDEGMLALTVKLLRGLLYCQVLLSVVTQDGTATGTWSHGLIHMLIIMLTFHVSPTGLWCC